MTSCSIQCAHVVTPLSETENLPTFDCTILDTHQIAIVGGTEAQKNALLEVFAGKKKPTKGHINYLFAENYKAQSSFDQTFKSSFDLISYVRMHHHFRNKSNTQTFYYQQRFNSDDASRVDTVRQYLDKIPSKRADGFWTTEKAIATLSIQHLTEESLIKLSNGETRRLMLAAALVKNPKLLLLDRPLIGLDGSSRQEFGGLLDQIIASGIQVILHVASHEIPSCMTHILEIKKDHIAYFPIEQLPSQYQRQDKPQYSLSESQIEELRLLLQKERTNEPIVPLVQMNNIRVIYGTKLILDQINWTLYPREIWALQGQNGAGKSTLLSLINGDHPQAYRNEIFLFGKRRGTGESIWDIKKKIGYVSPEFHQFFPKNQTCMQVILSGFYDTAGLFRQPTEAQKTIGLRWLTLFGLESFRTKPLALLAPDQQRLCLLARALIKHPPLLILDEPVQGLGADQREFIKAIIDQISEISDTAIIYVSHYTEDLPASINRVLHLHEGKVVNNTVE